MKRILSLCFICLFSYIGNLSAEVRFIANPAEDETALIKPAPYSDEKADSKVEHVTDCSQYPFEAKPDEQKGTVEACDGTSERYRYVACKDGWIFNKDKTDCVSSECADYLYDSEEIADCEKTERCNAGGTDFYKCTKCNIGFDLDKITGKCSSNRDFGEFVLDECPEGGICSEKTFDDVVKYKLDDCLKDYKLEDGACVCNKQFIAYGETDGRYQCSCPYVYDGEGMCFLEVYMEHKCDAYECIDQDYTAGGTRMYGIYFILNKYAADYLKIKNFDELRIEIPTFDGAGNSLGLLGGSNSFYMRESDCERLGKKYFSKEGVHIEYAEQPDLKGCVADCSAYTLESCPAKGICTVCGGKYKLDGCEKGFGIKNGSCQKSDGRYECYKFNSDWYFDPVESAECDCENYDQAIGGMLSPVENNGCSAAAYYCKKKDDNSLWVSKDCGSCAQGYKMNAAGKCEFIPCGAEYWLATNAGGNGFLNDIKMSGCKRTDACFKHYGPDAYIGNQKWFDSEAWGYTAGDKRDGCAPATNAQEYVTCLECEAGYHMVNNACIADSGVGSIYEYKGKPVGIVFYEDNEVIKLVSIENLGKPEIPYYTMRGGSDGHEFDWGQAMKAAAAYAPAACNRGSFCGKGKWHLPTVEEMSAVVNNYVNGGPILQAVRGLEASCSHENLLGLFNRYWTSTEIKYHVTNSSKGARDIDGAYEYMFPLSPMKGEKEMLWNARPVLTIQK